MVYMILLIRNSYEISNTYKRLIHDKYGLKTLHGLHDFINNHKTYQIHTLYGIMSTLLDHVILAGDRSDG